MILTWLAGKSDNIHALQIEIDNRKETLEYFKEMEKYYLEEAAKSFEEAKVKHRANNKAGFLVSYEIKILKERAAQIVRDIQICTHDVLILLEKQKEEEM